MRSAIEDYIKYIYTLQSSRVKIGTRNLAELMYISMPSVSEMIKKLTATGYISSKPYHGFKLTAKGEKIALTQIRKHRLLEHFMINTLDYDWEEVHQEADKLEHSVTEKFINRLEYFLGFPKFDPHGHPIPDINGKIRSLNSLPLSEAGTGKYYIVTSVNDRSKEILKYLKEIRIKINSKIKITRVLSFDGSVIIHIKGKKYLLSRKIADSIFVTENITN
jgi:DtxR family transcriptional regulator, Mn-dependent transcriptional regulator